MATVLNDNEAFKITLQIVEDFINDDYDAFIENGPTDDIKIIKWELVIYFKKLEGKKKSIVEYYMIPVYKYLKQRIHGLKKKQIGCYESVEYFDYIIDPVINQHTQYINALTIDFEKNIFAKTITIKFICDETYKFFEYKGESREIERKYNYLNQLTYVTSRAITSCISREGTVNSVHDYCKLGMNTYSIKQLKDIIKTHYSEIIKNIESYVLYCKVERIEIDIKKIIDRITYIKEYVKENYDITLV